MLFVARKAHRLVREIQISSQGAAQQSLIAIGQHDLLELIELRAAD